METRLASPERENFHLHVLLHRPQPHQHRQDAEDQQSAEDDEDDLAGTAALLDSFRVVHAKRLLASLYDEGGAKVPSWCLVLAAWWRVDEKQIPHPDMPAKAGSSGARVRNDRGS